MHFVLRDSKYTPISSQTHSEASSALSTDDAFLDSLLNFGMNFPTLAQDADLCISLSIMHHRLWAGFHPLLSQNRQVYSNIKPGIETLSTR